MTLANKLTLSRIFVIPVMVIVISIDVLAADSGFLGLTLGELIFGILFVIAAWTDYFDGLVARKNGQITNFGKFLDPLADKMLIVTALLAVMLKQPDRIPMWAVLIVIMREFMVTGIRLLAVDKGKVIAASPFGKVKTLVTMLALFILLFNDFSMPLLVGNLVFWLAIILTAVSGIDYLIKNNATIFEQV
ncbi:MAG: CDP-diacylglycerol--glycerol-3-phosphate 3-phosphatidyltransferase [Acholeplasmataceae bacterium]|nr:MAG: CDP-diacylglycerol--glycerol-3-phosphate 3-phosphatidyltransferase [Acholeplasmataceae bacterium]